MKNRLNLDAEWVVCLAHSEFAPLVEEARQLKAERDAINVRMQELEHSVLPDVHRLCQIILGNKFGNAELDSLAFYIGHHPDILNTYSKREEDE